MAVTVFKKVVARVPRDPRAGVSDACGIGIVHDDVTLSRQGGRIGGVGRATAKERVAPRARPAIIHVGEKRIGLIISHHAVEQTRAGSDARVDELRHVGLCEALGQFPLGAIRGTVDFKAALIARVVHPVQLDLRRGHRCRHQVRRRFGGHQLHPAKSVRRDPATGTRRPHRHARSCSRIALHGRHRRPCARAITLVNDEGSGAVFVGDVEGHIRCLSYQRIACPPAVENVSPGLGKHRRESHAFGALARVVVMEKVTAPAILPKRNVGPVAS